jgi:hypothetical protein
MMSLLVAIDHVSCTCSCARAYQRAFLSAYQRAAYCSNRSADRDVFGLAGAMMMSVTASLTESVRRYRQHHKYKSQEHRNDVLLFNSLYHFRSSDLKYIAQY